MIILLVLYVLLFWFMFIIIVFIRNTPFTVKFRFILATQFLKGTYEMTLPFLEGLALAGSSEPPRSVKTRSSLSPVSSASGFFSPESA